MFSAIEPLAKPKPVESLIIRGDPADHIVNLSQVQPKSNELKTLTPAHNSQVKPSSTHLQAAHPPLQVSQLLSRCRFPLRPLRRSNGTRTRRGQRGHSAAEEVAKRWAGASDVREVEEVLLLNFPTKVE